MYFILCDADVQLSRRFAGCPGGVWFSIFCDFCKPSAIPFTRSLHARLLILAHLMTSWISRVSPVSTCILRRASSFPLILVIVTALVPSSSRRFYISLFVLLGLMYSFRQIISPLGSRTSCCFGRLCLHLFSQVSVTANVGPERFLTTWSTFFIVYRQFAALPIPWRSSNFTPFNFPSPLCRFEVEDWYSGNGSRLKELLPGSARMQN